MGLTIDKFRFESQLLPSKETIRSHLQDFLPDLSGIEGIEIIDNTVEVRCMLDPYTRPYVINIMQKLGGIPVDWRTGEVKKIKEALPKFVENYWLSHSRWLRFKISVRYLFNLTKMKTC